MTTLRVRDFSCIDSGELTLARLTLLIGAQASGKSVISKLVYFFEELILHQQKDAQIETSWDAFHAFVIAEFKRQFPPSAWGMKTFLIEFDTGPISFRIERKRPWRKKVSEELYFTSSSWFEENFRSTAESYLQQLRDLNQDRHSSRWQVSYKVQEEARQRLSDALGDEHIVAQIFVPAGRSFFTSVGKAIAVFDQGGMLDPVTRDFGRFWAVARDAHYSEVGDDDPQQRVLMEEIFGGRLAVDRDMEYVESDDGRRVPVNALSSGQQELLPLWMALNAYFSGSFSSFMYIEEPEAHLFPTAQSRLIEYLTSKLYGKTGGRRRMLITTHSPYVITKINNLIKAHKVYKSSGESAQSKIEEIVPKIAWLKPDDVAAYAISNRTVSSIIDTESGLIEASYLDEVSNLLMDDFSRLLDIEYADGDPA